MPLTPQQLDQVTRIERATSATTDEQVLAMWLMNKSQGAMKTYISSIKQFLEFVNLPIPQIKIDDIFLYRNSLIQRGYAPATVTTKLMTVKSLFSFAYKIGYISFNVASIVRGMKDQDNLNQKILRAEDINKLLSIIDHRVHHTMVKVLVNTGLRVSELCQLRWCDLRDNLITIHGKGSKTRVISISDELLRDLLYLYRPYNTFIFSTRTGKPISRSNVHTYLKKYLKKAGVNESASCHWLRHTFASTALANGADLLLVSKTLGHDNISTTSRYLHTVKTECATDYVKF